MVVDELYQERFYEKKYILILLRKEKNNKFWGVTNI